MAISKEEFFATLARSGLLTDEQLSEVEASHRRDDNPTAIARALVDRQTITRWQANQLLAGRSSFFLGQYKLIGLLGRGGMGSVFLSEHTTMGRAVALKILSRKVGKDPASLKRFLSEARAIAALDHPNIVQAYSVDHEADRYYIVMEYIDGRDLQQIVDADGPLDYETASDYVRQAADGLAHGHAHDMIHCDVKPSNLLVSNQGVVKIVDMGLARLTDDDTTQHDDESLLGSVDYLAPEQGLRSPDFDHRADIYALGCTLYFLLTGHPPFNEGLLHERLMKHQSVEPPSILEERGDAPKELAELCRKMMAKRVDDRPQSAAEVSRVLSRRRPPVRTPPVRTPNGSPEDDSPVNEQPANALPTIVIEDTGRKPPVTNGANPATALPTADATTGRNKIVLWIAGIAIVLALVATTVVVTLLVTAGGDTSQQDGDVAVSDQSGQDGDSHDDLEGDLEGDLEDDLEDPEPAADPLPDDLHPDQTTSNHSTGDDQPNDDMPADDQPVDDPPVDDPPVDDPPADDPPEEESDPFRDLAATAELPALKGAAGQPDGPVSLGTLQMDAEDACDIELLGGEAALKGNRKFVMVRGQNDTDWLIQLEATGRAGEGPKQTDVARVWLEEKSLQFEWRDGAGEGRTANFLQNCALKITVDGKSRMLPLGRPTELSTALEVDLMKASNRIVLPADRLPDPEKLRLQITELSDGFPQHEFRPGDTITAKGKTDVVLLKQGLLEFKLRVSLDVVGRNTSVCVSAHWMLPGSQKESPFRANQAQVLMNGLTLRKQQYEALKKVKGSDKNKIDQEIRAIDAVLEQLRALETVYQAIHKKGAIHFRIFSVVDELELDLIVTPPPAPESLPENDEEGLDE